MDPRTATSLMNKRIKDWYFKQKGVDNLYDNNQKFREEIIYFVGDKTGLSNKRITDGSFKH